MAIKKTLREIKAEQNIEKITTTSKSLFADYGFDRVTVDDICAHAAVSKSTFYTHFSSKQDLLMISAGADRNVYLEAHYHYDDSKPLKELFHDFFFANFSYNRLSSHEWNRTTYLSYIKTHRQERREHHFYQDELRRLVQRAMDENAFREDLSFDEHFRMLHDWIIGFFIGWSVYPDDTPGVDEMYDHIMTAMINMVLK